MSNRQKLTLVGYRRPGTYIGQAYNPKAVNTGDLPFIPTYIGKGVPFLIAENVAIVRGFIRQEKLTFSQNAPFVANLDHAGDGKQASALASIRIYNASQIEIEQKYWRFVKSTVDAPYDQVQVFDPNYNPSEVYYIDYQSVDTDVKDKLGVLGVRSIRYIGDREYESYYKENLDFKMDTTVTEDVDSRVATGTGYFDIHPDTAYNAYNRLYHLRVEQNQVVQVPTLGTITATPSGNAGKVTLATTTAYTGLNVDTYTFTVANLAADSLDLTWTNLASETGTVHVPFATPNNIVGPVGLKLNVNVTGLADGNTFVLPVTQTTTHQVQFSWYTEDDSQYNSGLITITEATSQKVLLDSNIFLNFGTMVGTGPAVPTLSNLTGFIALDSFVIKCVNNDSLDWNFTRSITQEFTPGEVYYDALGLVTGTPRSFYVTLEYTPVGATSMASVTAPNTPLTKTDIAGKPYVAFNTAPLTNIRVTYTYQNAPQNGTGYYVTLLYSRPDSLYNTPIMFTSYRDALDQIGYPSADNHIAIMLDYAFNVAKSSLVAIVQVRDLDHDGVYNTADYREALSQAYRKKELTDIVVLGRFDTLSDQIYNSVISNDPMYGALRQYWIGYPKNYAVGSPDTVGTICYTSSNILQVSGASPAHGSLISVANQWVKRTITTESGQSVQLNLDGSFFAGMLCALQTASGDPNFLLLNTKIPGVDAVATFDDVDIQLLGSSSNTYAVQPDPNSNVATVVDIVTTDTSAEDYHEVNVMKAKTYVTKRIIKTCNAALVGYVPLNPQDGMSHVRAIIMRELTSMAGEGVIGSYTDDAGRPRTLLSSDVDVWRDEADKTRYNFTYWFNGRYGIKRLTGVYSVDENIFA